MSSNFGASDFLLLHLCYGHSQYSSHNLVLEHSHLDVSSRLPLQFSIPHKRMLSGINVTRFIFVFSGTSFASHAHFKASMDFVVLLMRFFTSSVLSSIKSTIEPRHLNLLTSPRLPPSLIIFSSVSGAWLHTFSIKLTHLVCFDYAILLSLPSDNSINFLWVSPLDGLVDIMHIDSVFDLFPPLPEWRVSPHFDILSQKNRVQQLDFPYCQR